MLPRLVLIKGAGDLASGVAHRLWFSGFRVVMLELPAPLVVRTTVSFASAVYEGSIEVESLTAKLCPGPEEAACCLSDDIIPVIVDPDAKSIDFLKPEVIIDAIMAKGNRLTKITDAQLVIGLGPGFTAGLDCSAVIETKRGHNLGKVIHSGSAADDTAEPGLIGGYGIERLLRAPAGGTFKPLKNIGETVKSGEAVAMVNDVPIRTQISGLIRGMLYPNLEIKAGTKVGDIDPRGEEVDYLTISDKARAIGGGVLEAILYRYNR
ncbi:MAG: EF2563 family selenium-dependent molybdenum hydroxylase system protein [Firmicutes bacterium]|nr:EF2563 family selenium-dependent molybdenum hydroxylase system protein [Bacillota bacterium]